MNRTNWADRASGATCVVRASYGSVLVVGPGWVITRAGGRPTRRVEVVARVLGVRHIIQAAVQLWLGPGRTAVAGAAVDALHAMSMVLVATTGGGDARLALEDAGAASLLALAGVATWRQALPLAS